MEPGAALPPGARRLRARGHPDAPGLLHPQLPAGQQVLARGDGLPPPRDGLHRQPANDRAERRARPARRRGRRGRAPHADGLAAVRLLRNVHDMVSVGLLLVFF